MNYKNEMTIKMPAKSINESFARSAVAAFCVELNPTLDEIADIKTAVSEAVTNCVVHAYPSGNGTIELWVGLSENCVEIKISDNGIGIENFNQALQPFFTTKSTEERAGMGFTVMESFMDNVSLSNNEGGGLVVSLKKLLGKNKKVEANA